MAAARLADPSLDHDSPLEELFLEQLMAADMVVLNKADRIDTAGRAAVEALIAKSLRPGVRAIWASHGHVDPRVALGLDMAAEDDLASRRSHHDDEAGHDHDDFESFVLSLPEQADPAGLVARLAEAARRFDILRAKGFLAVTGRPMRHVIQAVGARVDGYYDRPWTPNEPRRSSLVVIGLAGLDRPAIAAALGAEA